ncbi:O-antigen ligase family protein [Rhodomicrobium sp. Az07]|uniref:O-antigen ligase family protein n=1 Tax=Rhodomicrobium sp. Az07 TaxID=2839034 RepID=UPI001BE67231|nr:O-antigen ligase family protein [Rhodomicrobium sp. Az07]MBT3070327.1 O-antigen ligase family protein [Rhodomicrobium sp. Az07]
MTQAAAALLLCVALWPNLKRPEWGVRERTIAVAVLPVALVIALQIFPLPFRIWAGGESLLARDGASAIVPLTAWETFSLTPQATWAAAASLLVPIAIFCAVVRLNYQQRRMLCWIVLGLGALSLVIGFFQVAQGTGSSLRFYSRTNLTEAVGFFANRNHFAILLVVCLVLLGYWLTTAKVDRWAFSSKLLLWVAIALVFVSFLSGVMLARSRAGVLLAMLAIGGIAAIYFASRRRDASGQGNYTRTRTVVSVALIAMLLAVQFGLGRLATRFEEESLDSLRLRFAGAAAHSAIKSLPFGSGIGSFVPVYGAVEKSDHVRPLYANRAHNDLAEIFLETGILGAILVLTFLAWFLRLGWAVWRTPSDPEAAGVTALNRAATVIIVALLLHSLVDYPLRTTALAAIFAFFCGVLAIPATCEPPARFRHRQSQLHPREKVRPEAWVSEVTWPEDWQRTAPG